MHETETMVRANAAPWWRGVQLLIFKRESGEKFSGRIVWESLDESVPIDPSIEIDTEVAQTLMDDLWNCGLRPTEGSGSAGALHATQNHLKDLQRLVFASERQSKPCSPDND